jgi:hypothetical protein
MNDDNLICKIYFFDPEWKRSRKILGVVQKNQLFSPVNRFIELKNYGNKMILKKHLEEVILYENEREVNITENTLYVRDKTIIEG